MESPRKAYTVAEAAETLRVSEWLVREACRRGQIRNARIGSRIIIPSAAIDEILDASDDDGAAVP